MAAKDKTRRDKAKNEAAVSDPKNEPAKAPELGEYEQVKKIHPLYFNIVRKRYAWFTISLILLIPGIISLILQGFSLGIDFTGGTMMDVPFGTTVTQTAVSDALKSVELEGSVQLSDNDTRALIRTKALTEEEKDQLLVALSLVADFDKGDVLEEMVGPAMGQELTNNALKALAIACVLMILYITIRFQFAYAISGIIALLHDVLLVCGIFSIFQWQIDSTFVAAVLTIFGYSINDTVIIFDRVRENEAKMKRDESYEDMIDKSVWQTMRRSINTVVAVLIALFMIFIFGGESTKIFALAMLIGVFSGAYSSIFNASQILLEIKNRTKARPKTAGSKA
ncbi:MAG: protein translocase subunit SecF [Peptococcaceae bacterium]|jgi:preprotein translocase SecF subunit|nr:protein translocase subunit SecF [Peptococcaceae bacterium]